MDKLCSKCLENKDLELFAKRTKSPDGRTVWCKACFAKYERERYQNGDRVRKERNRDNTRIRSRNYILEYLSGHPCVDCSESDPMVLEFDHRDNVVKVYNVCEMQTLSVKRISEEVAKCDVRCANCHKRRTAKQFGYWKYVGEVLR